MHGLWHRDSEQTSEVGMKVKLDREHLDKVIAKALLKDAKEIASGNYQNESDARYFAELYEAMRKVAEHYEP